MIQAHTCQPVVIPAPPGWTDVRIETLKTLWNDGLSASQVARQLGGGATRSAVLGKIYRLGLCGRGSLHSERLASKPSRLELVSSTAGGEVQKRSKLAPPASRTTPRPPPQTTPAVVNELRLEAPGMASSFIELGPHACKWPIGDPRSESFSFCGRHADGSYCAHHSRVAHQPRKARPLEQEAGQVELIRGSQQRTAA